MNPTNIAQILAVIDCVMGKTVIPKNVMEEVVFK